MKISSSLINFIIRRSFFSFLVIPGVLLLTFLLFRVAAGDPARTVLGKNPSPKEIENMRLTLSSDKPLIWGYWRMTEIFTSADFAKKRQIKGITVSEECKYNDKALSLNTGRAVFSRNFDADGVTIKLGVEFCGSIKVIMNYSDAVKDEILKTDSWEKSEITFKHSAGKLPAEIIFTSPGGDGMIKNICFSRRQSSPWDSQLLASLKEIVWVKDSFPYVTFFNFGRTLITRESVKDVLKRGVIPSLSLMVPIFLGELLLGIIFALLSSAFRDRWPDRIIMLASIAGMSVSYIVFMIFGQWFLGYYYDIFPVWGYGTFLNLGLPVSIGIISGLGGGVRFYRTIFVNETRKEYLRTARAKGCSTFSIYCRHLLRNAAVPLITRVSSILPFLFTGSLLLESFFGIPGLGYAGVNALMNADLQMLKALVIITAFLFVGINLLADISYAWADPRMR